VGVVDIGGGSTEVSLIDASAVSAASGPRELMTPGLIACWQSLPLGVVTLAERFAHLDEAAAYRAMRSHACDCLAQWRDAPRLAEAMGQPGAHLIGTSGTVTCLAGVHLGLARYRRDAVDGLWLTRGEADDVIARLRALGPDGRAGLATIGPERAQLMLSGCAILDAVWDLFPAKSLRVADRGLREGVLLTMMHGPRKARRRAGRAGRGRRKATAAETATPAGGAHGG